MGVLNLDAQRVSMTVPELNFEIFSSGEGPTLQTLILCQMSFLPELSDCVSLGLLPPTVHTACNILSLHFLLREGLR